MFGTLGGPELLLILVIALIVFGPRKLPEIGKSLGKMMGEFRRASNDFKRTIEDEVEADKLRSSLDVGSYDSPTPSPYAAPATPAAEPAADVASPYAEAETSAAEPVLPAAESEAVAEPPAAADALLESSPAADSADAPPPVNQG
jgi:TatA/E family protein of Tat protein translocase